MRELLTKNDGALENPPFRRSLYIHAKAPREQLLQNNQKHGSRPKDSNKNKYKSKNTGPPQVTIACPRLKVNPVQFYETNDHIHHMEHTHENTHLLDTQEQDMENNEAEKYEFYERKNDELITEEELEHIHLYLDHNFKSPKMNSIVMSIRQNDSENIIDDPEDFLQ